MTMLTRRLHWSLLFIVAFTTLFSRAKSCVFDCNTAQYCGPPPIIPPVIEYAAQLDLSTRGIENIASNGLECAEYFNITQVDLSDNSFMTLPPLTTFNSLTDAFGVSDYAVVILDNNQISEIPQGYFNHNMSLQNLKLSVVGNALTKFDNGIFSGCSGCVLFLDLANNNISTLGASILTGFDGNSLVINFSNNSMTDLQQRIFSGDFSQVLGSAISLDLSFNHISKLEAKTFAECAGCELSIDLSNNLLTQVETNTFSEFQGTSLTVSLNNNSITRVFGGAFSDLTGPPGQHAAVSFQHNAITSLSESLFSGYGCRAGLVLDFDNNVIENISAYAFIAYTGPFLNVSVNNNLVSELDPFMFGHFDISISGAANFDISLNNNRITYLPPFWFEQFNGDFLFVRLSNNGITELGPNVFAGFVQAQTLHVSLAYNGIQSLPSGSLSGFEGSGAFGVDLNNNNISFIAPGFSSGIDNHEMEFYLANNPLQCSEYTPTLSACSCTSAFDTLYSKCGYFVCSQVSLECESGYYPTSSCALAPRSVCIQQCPNTSEYMKLASTATTVEAICFPMTTCNATAHVLPTYQYVNATSTSDRVCRPCTQCPVGFRTVPCTILTDSSCFLSPTDVALIVLSTLFGIGAAIALCRWGLNHKSEKEKTRRSYVQQAETLELTTKLLGVEEKKSKDTELSWMIDWCDLQIGKVLGRGGFGVVSQAQWLGSSVAVKVLEVRVEVLDIESGAFEREVAAMQSLHHPNLVAFYGFGTTSVSKPFLVTELMNQTLRERLRENKTKVDVDWNEARRWCADIVAGMLFLHTRTPPMVHRDLKSDNCLLGENDIVKIADFGTVTRPSDGESKFTSSATTSTSLVMSASIGAGTPLWMAPEVMSGLHGISHYGLSVDVYSFGMVMYEIATQQLPFCPDCDSMNQFEFNDFVIGGGRPQVKEGLPKAYVQLMEQCWSNDPESRPTFTQLSPMFAKLKLHTMSSLFFGSANQSS
eukprot:m.236061 g.236061  ORF g.236061 m.236061 type:complete len:989 (-) comp33674_c0_seq8:336-3302(-)